MKVMLSKESKKIITLADAPKAKRLIDDMKEDTTTTSEYAKYAIEAACKSNCIEVFKATAEIARNNRTYNAYFEDSELLDVWIDAIAQTSNGFIIIGTYLTDIWKLNGDNTAQITKHMYLRKFKEC